MAKHKYKRATWMGAADPAHGERADFFCTRCGNPIRPVVGSLVTAIQAEGCNASELIQLGCTAPDGDGIVVETNFSPTLRHRPHYLVHYEMSEGQIAQISDAWKLLDHKGG